VVLSPVYHSRTYATATVTTITMSDECVLRAVAQEYQEAVTSTIMQTALKARWPADELKL
jgi:hypothetical protein